MLATLKHAIKTILNQSKREQNKFFRFAHKGTVKKWELHQVAFNYHKFESPKGFCNEDFEIFISNYFQKKC